MTEPLTQNRFLHVVHIMRRDGITDTEAVAAELVEALDPSELDHLTADADAVVDELLRRAVDAAETYANETHP